MADSRRRSARSDKSAADPPAYTDLYRCSPDSTGYRRRSLCRLRDAFQCGGGRVNRRRSISRGRQPAGALTKICSMWGREERGDFTQHAFVSGDITPAHNRQGFALQLFFNDAACGSGEFRIFIQEEHPDSVVFLLNASRAPAQRCEKSDPVFVTASRNRRRFYHRRESRHGAACGPVRVLQYALPCGIGSPSMWAIRPKPQLSLSRDLSYNIS